MLCRMMTNLLGCVWAESPFIRGELLHNKYKSVMKRTRSPNLMSPHNKYGRLLSNLEYTHISFSIDICKIPH